MRLRLPERVRAGFWVLLLGVVMTMPAAQAQESDEMVSLPPATPIEMVAENVTEQVSADLSAPKADSLPVGDMESLAAPSGDATGMDAPKIVEPSPVVAGEAVIEDMVDKAPTEWIWGEVVSVSASAMQVVIKHIDYESYDEVETTLKFSGKTEFENVSSLAEIKAGDYITVDYSRNEAGENIAEVVVVEKPVVLDEDVELTPTSKAGEQMQSVSPEAPAESKAF